MKLVYSAVLALMFSCAYSFVFFDDFSGEDINYSKWLWMMDDANLNVHYVYDVSDSWLSMNELWGKNNINSVYLAYVGGGISLQTFEVKARVRWDEISVHTLQIGIGEGAGPQLSGISLSYISREGEEPFMRAFFSNWGGTNKNVPAPGPGEHVFRVGYDGNMLYAYIDDLLVHSDVPTYTQKATGVNIYFSGPHISKKDLYSPLHVDWVGVVPEPATLNLLFAGLFVLWKKYKKSH